MVVDIDPLIMIMVCGCSLWYNLWLKKNWGVKNAKKKAKNAKNATTTKNSYRILEQGGQRPLQLYIYQ